MIDTNKKNDFIYNLFQSPNLLFSILIILFVIMTNFVIFMNIPIFRQIFGFIYLTYIPGTLLLNILDINIEDFEEKILFNIGLSIFLVIFYGLIINEIGILFKFYLFNRQFNCSHNWLFFGLDKLCPGREFFNFFFNCI